MLRKKAPALRPFGRRFPPIRRRSIWRSQAVWWES